MLYSMKTGNDMFKLLGCSAVLAQALGPELISFLGEYWLNDQTAVRDWHESLRNAIRRSRSKLFTTCFLIHN